MISSTLQEVLKENKKVFLPITIFFLLFIFLIFTINKNDWFIWHLILLIIISYVYWGLAISPKVTEKELNIVKKFARKQNYQYFERPPNIKLNLAKNSIFGSWINGIEIMSLMRGALNSRSFNFFSLSYFVGQVTKFRRYYFMSVFIIDFDFILPHILILSEKSVIRLVKSTTKRLYFDSDLDRKYKIYTSEENEKFVIDIINRIKTELLQSKNGFDVEIIGRQVYIFSHSHVKNEFFLIKFHNFALELIKAIDASIKDDIDIKTVEMGSISFRRRVDLALLIALVIIGVIVIAIILLIMVLWIYSELV